MTGGLSSDRYTLGDGGVQVRSTMETIAKALYASVSFKKVPGTLILHPNGVLEWNPSSSTSSVRGFRVPDIGLKGIQVSKPGAAQVALRIIANDQTTINGDSSALLVFSADADTAGKHRETFKERLAAAIAKTRVDQQQPPTQTGTATAHTAARMQNGTKAGREVNEVTLRGRVLRSNPQLLALHKEVVGSGTLSDADFWAHPTRATLLRAERAQMEQQAGRRGQLADPHPTQNEAGELKINITPQLIRDLFEQYPVLTRAYDENVPSRLDENTFWMRYFQSKLYHRLRTSLRSAASEQHLPSDDIFDKYLEAEDDGLEPRQPRNPHDALLNLASTEEDHTATGNIQDWTMRPGFDRRTLPLVRRFNKHAESLLTSSLGTLDERDARRVRRKTGGVDEEYEAGSEQQRKDRNLARDRSDIPWESHYEKDIVIPDLTERQSKAGRRLIIQDPHMYQAPDTNEEKSEEAEQTRFDYQRFRDDMAQWRLDLRKYVPSGATMDKTLRHMLENMKRQKEQRTSRALDELSADVYKRIVSCHAATSEFLQQFWQAVLPSMDHKHVDMEERVDKARYMLKILRRTDTRIEDIATAADSSLPGEGYDIVMDAFRTTREAVKMALTYAGEL